MQPAPSWLPPRPARDILGHGVSQVLPGHDAGSAQGKEASLTSPQGRDLRVARQLGPTLQTAQQNGTGTSSPASRLWLAIGGLIRPQALAVEKGQMCLVRGRAWLGGCKPDRWPGKGGNWDAYVKSNE